MACFNTGDAKAFDRCAGIPTGLGASSRCYGAPLGLGAYTRIDGAPPPALTALEFSPIKYFGTPGRGATIFKASENAFVIVAAKFNAANGVYLNVAEYDGAVIQAKSNTWRLTGTAEGFGGCYVSGNLSLLVYTKGSLTTLELLEYNPATGNVNAVNSVSLGSTTFAGGNTYSSAVGSESLGLCDMGGGNFVVIGTYLSNGVNIRAFKVDTVNKTIQLGDPAVLSSAMFYDGSCVALTPTLGVVSCQATNGAIVSTKLLLFSTDGVSVTLGNSKTFPNAEQLPDYTTFDVSRVRLSRVSDTEVLCFGMINRAGLADPQHLGGYVVDCSGGNLTSDNHFVDTDAVPPDTSMIPSLTYRNSIIHSVHHANILGDSSTFAVRYRLAGRSISKLDSTLLNKNGSPFIYTAFSRTVSVPVSPSSIAVVVADYKNGSSLDAYTDAVVLKG